jgi:acyl-coenzyme A thioesterase PaaI-like protein
MDIEEVPFNRLLGMRKAAAGSGHLVELADDPRYTNHLGTVHAGAQLALAEGASAVCLRATFPDLEAGAFAVVRRLEAKFRNPLRGRVRARASVPGDDAGKFFAAYGAKGRSLIAVAVEVVDDGGVVGLSASVEWFVQKRPAEAAGG